jgi:hypothetical protein
MTTIKITKKLTSTPIPFSGMFDSDPITLNGDVMRLYANYCPAMKNGAKEKVLVKILELDRYFNTSGKVVDEGSADDTIGEFEGFLEKRNGKLFFSEMKPCEEIKWDKVAPYPYFRITFARENDIVTNRSDNATDAPTFPVVIGKNDEPPESPMFEIGFMITKASDGSIVGSSEFVVSHFYGEYSYRPFLKMFDIRTQLDSVNLLKITNAQFTNALGDETIPKELFHAAVASTTASYQGSIAEYNDRKLKTVKAALKEIENLIKSSNNPYFQNIKAVNEYYELLEQYQGQVEQYQKMRNTQVSTQGDCYAMENGILLPMVQKLNKLEETIHQYLKDSDKPPKEYIDRINNNIAIIKRNKNIDEILNNPLVRMIGLLPGAGVVTGTLKVIKGDTVGGFIDIFGSIVTYGSFIKLARVAQAYRKSTQNTTELLFNYRYRKLVSSITNAKIWEKLEETTLRQVNQNVGILFETVNRFKSIKGHIDSIALLHKNKKYILDTTQKAIAGINGGLITDTKAYIVFLNNLQEKSATLEFFAHLRVLHAMVKGSRDAYKVTLDAMDDVDELLGFKEVPGVKEFDPMVSMNIGKMFTLMEKRGFKIDEIIASATSSYSSDSAIIEHFNKDLIKYDMFGLKVSADVRYSNNRDEMLMALNAIVQSWTTEKQNRDKWIEANKANYIHKYVPELQIQWARQNKSSVSAGLPESLETRIANFIDKLKGQIAQAEALGEKGELPILENSVREGTVYGTNFIYNLDGEGFKEVAENLVKRYFF